MDGQSVTIIGVMPPISVGGQIGWRSIWTPLRVNEAGPTEQLRTLGAGRRATETRRDDRSGAS